MKTVTTSVGFQDPLGNLVANGKLILDLSQPAEVASGGGLIVPKRVVLSLTVLAVIAPTSMWFNDELNPTGTTYHSTLIDSNLNQVADFGQWSITGASADLSTMVPVSGGGGSAANAVLLNPVGQQNINGQTLNLEGAALGFSAVGSTTADVFLSRNAAGVLQIGTTSTNASGSLFNSSSFANGTAAAPSITFTSTTNRGLFNDTSFGGLGLTSGGVAQAYVIGAGLTVGPKVYGMASAITGAPDTGLSRTAAGEVSVGNGTAGNASGTVSAATYKVAGIGITGTGGGLVRGDSATITTAQLSGCTITGTTAFLGQNLTDFRVQNYTGLTVNAPNAIEGQQFSTTLTWSSSFANATYLVMAQLQNVSAGTPVVIQAVAASASTVTVTFANASAVQSTVTGVLLVGIHL